MSEQTDGSQNKLAVGVKMMMWVLGAVFVASVAMFIGGMVYSFRAAGRVKRHLTLVGLFI